MYRLVEVVIGCLATCTSRGRAAVSGGRSKRTRRPGRVPTRCLADVLCYAVTGCGENLSREAQLGISKTLATGCR
jgi:hypothetical protein